MDSIIHRLHIYPLCEIFDFRAIDKWVMFKLTGLNQASNLGSVRARPVGLDF